MAARARRQDSAHAAPPFDWEQIRLFLAVVREGSLAGAAARMGLDVSTVSRRLDRLEERVGAPLFDRTRDGTAPSAVAEQLVAHAEEMERSATRFAAGGASVVNLASMSALRAVPLVPGYGAAKAGIIDITRNLAVKWAGKGIRVNAVAPGTIDTPMTAPMHIAAELVESELAHIPLRRFGSAGEIAPTVAFLCTEQSSYTTGAVFVVDGASDCI